MTGPSRTQWEVGYCAVNSVILQFGVEGGSKIVHGISRPDSLIFIVPYAKFADRVIFDGQEVQPYDFAVLPPSSHFTAATFGSHRWMSISLPTRLFGEVAAQVTKSNLEWIEKEKWLVSTPRRLAERLATEAVNAATLSGEGPPLEHQHHGGGIEISLLNSLIAAIAGANNKVSLSDDTAKSSRKIMSRALEYARLHKWQALHVNDLALAADVTDRTLHRSFRQQLDIGPARYLKLRQLNVVRRALRGKLASPKKVLDVMSDHGVSEFGRFATEYRTLFGESPSETMRLAALAV